MMKLLSAFRILRPTVASKPLPGPAAPTVRPACAGSSSPTLAPLIVLVFPLLLALVDVNWLLPRPDTVDPWMYIAHFLAPAREARIDHMYYEYHAGRLPIILPGAGVCRALPLDAALIVLHLGLYYVASFSLFGALANLV